MQESVSQMDDLPTIDAHAHVWDRECTFVPGARYHPAYEATIDTYLRVLDRHEVGRAVLVQPSFLGTDNTYLLATLRAHPDRLRGIVVVDPSISEEALDAMADAGVIGVRYNLLSMSSRLLSRTEWQDLTARIAARGWRIEIQAMGADWPEILPNFADAKLMIDHFGKPDGADCAGLAALLGRDPTRTCVKLSAPYRQRPQDLSAAAQGVVARFGAHRCLWGSDWPWTQHEGLHTYRDCQSWLLDWTNEEQRRNMAGAAPALTGFAPAP